MKLVIAEKPSVAMALAAVLGANEKKDGYLEGGGYLVSGPRDCNAAGRLYQSGFGAGKGFRIFHHASCKIERGGQPFPATRRKFFEMSERCNISPRFSLKFFDRCNISRTFGFYNILINRREALKGVLNMSILQTIDLKKYYGTKPNITRALAAENPPCFT